MTVQAQKPSKAKQNKIKTELLAKCKKAWLEVQLNFDDTSIENVRIQYSPQTWVNVLDREGEILGVCCGNISRIRDILCQALCDSGYIHIRDLAEVHSLIISHDCSSAKKPLKQLVTLWENVNEVLEGKMPELRTSVFNAENVEDCLQALETALPSLIFNKHMFNNDSLEQQHLSKIQTIAMLRTVIPSIHTLHKKIEEICPEPLEGFAVVDKNTGKVLEGRAGLLILKDEEFAKEIANLDKADIKRCRISLENGIEFI